MNCYRKLETWTRDIGRTLVLCAVTLMTLEVIGAEQAFNVGGAVLTLQEVTTDVEVRYQSMRLNRALNVWNVEVTLTNRSSRVLRGPFLLSIESFSGTPGPLRIDGIDGGGKVFYDVSGAVLDGVLGGGEKSLPRTLTLGVGTGAPKLVTKVFVARDRAPVALALARTLNEAGQPLPDTGIEETGPTGTTNQTSDPVFGVATLGQGSGNHVWKFSHPEYLPVWRQEMLSVGEVTVVGNPRLVRRSANVIAVTPIGGGQLSEGSVQISLSPGAFAQNGTATLTLLTGQTLPAYLPPGWSPLQGFWLETTMEPALPVSASLQPWGPLSVGETVALVRWNETAWEVTQLLSGNGTNALSATLPKSGAYALVVGDAAPQAPPVPQIGQPLQPSNVSPPNLNLLTATGSVNPASSPASRTPELVTGTATVVITNRAGPMPSGLALRCEVSESYRLQDGTGRHPPQYENFVIGYQRPGDANPSTLQASFPLRPLLLFGAEELSEATVQVEVLTPTPFGGGVLDGEGGLVASEGLRVLAGAGDITGQQAAQVRRLNPTNFTDVVSGNMTVLAAFELSVAGVAHHLIAQVGPVPTNATVVVARVLYDQGLYGLQPVERLSSDGAGKLSSAEPLTGDRLTGIVGAGQYLIVQLNTAQGMVSGVARNSGGQAAGGLPVRVAGQPWLVFSETNGVFRLLAPVGTASVAVTDFATGDTGLASFTVTDPQSAVVTSVSTAPTGPRVVSITPTNGAVNVSRVTPITIEFSEAVNPGTLLNGGIQVIGTNGQPVTASLTLNLRNTTATLLPTEQLAPSVQFTVQLSTNIADVTGLKLEGASTFGFTTLSDALNRGLGAQVVSYEPTNGVARMEGTQGIADPEVPVILVNETTGRTSTVLSKPDGSFTGSIQADVEDFLSAVFVNRNGTRNTIPVSRQLFRDGSVGLFNGGGILEAQSDGGPVQVLVEPGAIETKTKFRMQPVPLTQILALLSNAPPELGQVLGGFRYSREGDELVQSPDVSFPVNPADLGLPPNTDPTNASFALTVAREVDGVTVYEIVDRMHYESGKLVTHSLPFFGLLGPFEDVLVAPLLLAPGHSLTVSGRVVAGEVGTNGQPNLETARYLPGAVVTFSPSGAIGPPGRLNAGAFMATARGTNAYFSTMIPASRFDPLSGAVALRATHPRFPGATARRVIQIPSVDERLAIGNILSPADLVFHLGPSETNDTHQPNIFISHAPYVLAPGSTGEVRVVALDDFAAPFVQVSVERVNSLVSGTNATRADVVLTPGTQETVGSTLVRAQYQVTCTKPAEVVLKATAVDSAGNLAEALYAVAFGANETVSTDVIPPADPNDRTGPTVIYSSPPPHGRGLVPGAPIVLRFSEPIRRTVLEDSFAIYHTPLTAFPKLQLSADQQELRLFYSDLQPDTEYTLTVTPAIRDLVGNRLDQDATTAGEDSFVLTYRTAPKVDGSLPGMVQGGGIVSKGIYSYALERRGSQGGAMVVFDLSNPAAPERVAEIGVPGQARDLALIPGYSFKRRPDGPVETDDLVAVVGGDIGSAVGQFLWVIDISHPLAPRRVAARRITLSSDSAVIKVMWAPPLLAYLELGDPSSIGIVNLQAFVLGELFNEEIPGTGLQWPPDGTPGLDLNGDGDFVDPGEELPYPRRRGDFAGKVFTHIVPDTDQRIIDFTIEDRGQFIGVVLDAGHVLNANGIPTTTNAPPAYRTLFSGLLELPREVATVTFTNARPTRVFTLFDFDLTLSNRVQRVDLALVSVTSDTENTNRLVVLDISIPSDPQIIAQIGIPADRGTPPYSIHRREDGLLLLATLKDLLILDPARFGEPASPGSPHPAIVGFIPDAGSGSFSFHGSIDGLNLVNQGGKNRLIQTAPRLDIVSLTNVTPFAPSAWIGLSDGELDARLAGLRFRDFLVPSSHRGACAAESDLIPPRAETHYYVLVRAPGSAGATIELALESLNWAGAPLKPQGFLFPEVHALSPQALLEMGQVPGPDDAPVTSCRAWRLSTNPASSYYNTYLSRPITLLYEEMSRQDLDEVNAGLVREMIWSGDFLRATFDPSMDASQVLGRFAGRVNSTTRQLEPGSTVVAVTFPADYIQTPNPMPITGGAVIPAALGSVGAQNSEFMHSTTDLLLPGRRLPIEFRRSNHGQALYNGPFGRGWDFNYNQRLIECRDTVFPGELQQCLVVRDDAIDREIATRGDLKFYNGGGRIILYKFAGTNAPPEMAADPLMQQLGWITNASRFYFSPPGVFNCFIKFKDGTYARLEPDGVQYWYDNAGRLSRVYDRYPGNSLRLVYGQLGELIQIQDELRRPVDVGHWRLLYDPNFRLGIDEKTENPSIAGRICRLKDYSHRDVLFYYTDEGLLDRREGPNVTTALPGSFAGRQVARYSYSDTGVPERTAKSLVAVTSGDPAGNPLMALTQLGASGRDTISRMSLANGPIQISLGQTNTARQISLGGGTSHIVAPDGAVTDYTFDKFGRPQKVKLSGYGGLEHETRNEYYPNGLIRTVTYPEGNSIEFTYDSGNPSYRSRGNIIRITKLPGPRGGPVLVATSQFDPHYNLPAGQITDYNTNVALITLFPDHGDPRTVTKGGETETYSVNEYGQRTSHTATDGITRTWSYDSATGFLTSQGVGGLLVQYGYSGDAGLRGLATSITDATGVITLYTFDQRNQVVIVSRAGVESKYLYDENGNCTQTTSTADAGRLLIEDRTYNQVGFMTSKILRDVEVGTGTNDLVTTFEPDEVNRVRRVTFPGGDVHQLYYDHLGRVIQYRIGTNYSQTYAFDRNGNQTSTAIGPGIETYLYDGHDRLASTITPRGTRINTILDGNGNMLETATTDSSGGLLSRTRYSVDGLDRYSAVTRERDTGTVTVVYHYYPSQRMIEMIDGKGAVSRSYYDSAGRVAREELPSKTFEFAYDNNGKILTKTSKENGLTFAESFDYNLRGHLTSVTDNLGNVTSFEPGLDGRVLSVTDREGYRRTNSYTLLGEPRSMANANGVLIQHNYDGDRRLTRLGDSANHGSTNTYDDSAQLVGQTLPNGARRSYGSFDPLGQPRQISHPRGVAVHSTFEVDGTLTDRTVSGLGPTRQESYRFDGMRRQQFVSDPSGSVEYVRDRLGFIKEFRFSYAGLGPQYSIFQEADNGGFRSRVTYPSGGPTITNSRDATGRLISLVPDQGEPILQNTVYLADSLVGQTTLGADQIGLQLQYDSLKRPISRRYFRLADGLTLVDLRYVYDRNGAQLGRQFVHRGGRADFFRYDPGYRLIRVDQGVRPALPAGESTNRVVDGFAKPQPLTGSWFPGLFARELHYSPLDGLESSTLINPDNQIAPIFATSFTNVDELLHAGQIDGVIRTRDEEGNVTHTRLAVRLPGVVQPALIEADLEYNDLGQLTRISRSDGVVIQNYFGPSGLRLRRTVTGAPARCVPTDIAFVYDGANLIEERDLNAGGAVRARYYYGDQGDELIAGDLRLSGGGALQRHYFLTDASRSVLAIADVQGRVVERMQYDAWGQPGFQSPDEAPPRVSRITLTTNGLLVEFTERVLPAFAAPLLTNGFVLNLQDPNTIFEVRTNGQLVASSVRYEETSPGRAFGSTFRLVLTNSSLGAIDLTVRGGGVQDESNQTNPAEALTLQLGVPTGSVLYSGASPGSTAPVEIGRSAFVASFLFHGQFFDFDSGLVYCRARFYDPSIGLFLQRDPEGYLDGVNHYAAFGNDPVNHRDPTGTKWDTWGSTLANIGHQADYSTDGIGGFLTGAIVTLAGRVLEFGTAVVEGKNLMTTQQPGTFGLLEEMQNANVFINDVQTGTAALAATAGAASLMRYSANGALGAATRIRGYFTQAGNSPSPGYALRKYFRNKGKTAIEADSIMEAMKEQGVTRLTIRDFGEKAAFRQRAVSLGYTQKDIHTKGKIEVRRVGGEPLAVSRDGRYTSDGDILHVEINGRNATLDEVDRFTARANELYEKRWNAAGKNGYLNGRGEVLGINKPANPPFRHGAHLDMAQSFGQSAQGHLIDMNYIKGVGHPGDSITIRNAGDGNILVYDTPRWWTQQKIDEYGEILKKNQAAMGMEAVGWPTDSAKQRDWYMWENQRQHPQYGSQP